MTASDSRAALRVVSAGLCCSLGYRLEAVECALRAQVDAFSESYFRAPGGHAVRVARLPDDDVWGAPRNARWMDLAIRDCLRQAPDLDPRRTALVAVLAEQERPLADQRRFEQALAVAMETASLKVEGPTAVIAQGKSGLAAALELATRWLSDATHPIDHVLLCSVDSHLHAANIDALLNAERLLVPGRPDGFIPGEAAACLLLAAGDEPAPGLALHGWGQGQEDGRPDGSVPSRAFGLSQALRMAFQRAGVTPAALRFRVSDQNGEAFFAREAANALTRVFFGTEGPARLITVADLLGDVGAATGPAMLAYLWQAAAVGHAPAGAGFVHLADAHGGRVAVVIQGASVQAS
ncbi:hypothetical protein [Mitsuaria sp. GD03876]|uniref:hypothetical protein n=1 Tax=Mitsuaria sp. GD03876 TaxID=2975399 RepID=UPI00244D51F7|nr:hypothetical protein [Mitsuaria sp. GD03876]MDH0868137.1 hypothetical protein [Mitsuaria sp. GD03876]